MKYNLAKDLLDLLESFEDKNHNGTYSNNIEGFKKWIVTDSSPVISPELDWEGKFNGRTIDSVISTLLVHMNKYAKSYSKSAIHNSNFSTQEEFIFLITLNSFGSMSKMDLIRKNKTDKPTGIQIINRLIKYGWVDQITSEVDKRSKILQITSSGKSYLEDKMNDIRKATKIVTANLTEHEKLELVRILTKMDLFHQKIYNQNIPIANLLEEAYQCYTEANSQK